MSASPSLRTAFALALAAAVSLGLALVFEARIGTRTIEGVDFLRLNSLGLVDDFRVMVRPHSALEALMEAMVPAIERVLAEQSSAG